jgi:hypothetical protein
MSYLTACQPGWSAVFANVNDDGFSTEPIACWLLRDAPGNPEVRPICALGGDVCDASEAENYLGVAGPGVKPEAVYEATRAARTKRSA